MSSIRYVLAAAGCVLCATPAWSEDHLRFTDVTLPVHVTERLLHAGRAPFPDDVARQLAEDFPELHIVVFESNLTPDQHKLRWRDPRVQSEVARFYAVQGWLARTLDNFIPKGYTPYAARPLMQHDLLLVRDYASREVLLGGAIKYVINRELIATPGRASFVDVQDESFDTIDGLGQGQEEVARLTLVNLRQSVLREVDVAEWLLVHRRELKLTPAQLKSVMAHATAQLMQAIRTLTKVQSAAVPGAVDAESKSIRDQVPGVLAILRAVGCELDL